VAVKTLLLYKRKTVKRHSDSDNGGGEDVAIQKKMVKTILMTMVATRRCHRRKTGDIVTWFRQ
jgi:hypothetical protein